MSKEELRQQLAAGVVFSCYVEGSETIAVMGTQDKSDVMLIRHAYVRTPRRGTGIGTTMLRALMEGSTKPVLIGTWRAPHWAISFYQKNGFTLVEDLREKDRLLAGYWTVAPRQARASVVLSRSARQGGGTQ